MRAGREGGWRHAEGSGAVPTYGCVVHRDAGAVGRDHRATGDTGAQTTGKVVIPVSGTTSNGGAFKGKIVNPKITYRETADSFMMAGTLVGKVINPNGTEKAVNGTSRPS